MANSVTTQAPRNNTPRKVFASYFKARWQNWQSVVSKDVFYSKMPAEWINYQKAFVAQWGDWSRGFVPALHKGDFFATGMGKTAIDILVRECMRGGYRFDSKSEIASAVVTKWAKEEQFDMIARSCFKYANSLGNAVLRLNINADTLAIYPTAHAVSSCFFEVNRKGKVVKAKFYDMLSAGTTKGQKYYAVEERVFLDGVPFYKVCVNKYDGTVNNSSFVDCGGLDALDDWSRSVFKELYGNIKLDCWYKLPFNSLGCYNWKNMESSSVCDEMIGYADSSLHTALDILYAIDYNYTMGQLDQYFGKTRVLIPKPMQRPENVKYVVNGEEFEDVFNRLNNSPLEDDFFTQVPNDGFIDNKPAEPIFMQPDVRGLTRKQLHDHYLEILASKVGLSSSTLANHLTYSNSKTATEVVSEQDTTDTTVAFKRELANSAIDDMLKDVTAYMGLCEDVDITWNYTGNANIDRIMDEYTRRVAPLRETIRKLHPELTEVEVDAWVSQLEQEKQQSEEDTGNIMQAFGLGDEY